MIDPYYEKLLAEFDPQEVREYIARCLQETKARLSLPRTSVPSRQLYFTACEKDTVPYVAQVVQAFRPHAFDFKIVVYDDSRLSEEEFKDCEIIYQKGFKWPLASELLSPEVVKPYEHIFIWDSDIDVSSFQVNEFLDIVRRNQIEMSQPALTRDSYFTWELTLQRSDRIGRMSDFVEIMVPVFTREAWERFRGIIRNSGNPWGYGYDLYARAFCQFACMAIVDATPVKHWQPVHSRQAAQEALDSFRKANPNLRCSNVMSYLNLK